MKHYFLFFGLGNPEPRYQITRHNAGFLVIDEILNQNHIEPRLLKERRKNLITETVIKDQPVILAKPLTYMNNSGDAVRTLMDYYKVEPNHILVFVDDIDIPFPSIRIRQKGGSGTHNGLKSIISQIGKNFPRIRIGVKNSLMEKMDLSSFVLGKFTKEEQKQLPELITSAVKAGENILTDGIDKTMSLWNSKNH